MDVIEALLSGTLKLAGWKWLPASLCRLTVSARLFMLAGCTELSKKYDRRQWVRWFKGAYWTLK